MKHIRIKSRPNKWHENDCPFCHKSCPAYDKHSSRPTTWRGLDWGGILVEVEYQTHRIICLEHGVYVAEVPWAYPGSRFIKDFDLTVAWFASYLPRSTTSYFMRVDWETVGRCVNRALHDLEPERSRRLDGLVNISIDKISYKRVTSRQFVDTCFYRPFSQYLSFKIQSSQKVNTLNLLTWR